MYDKIKRIEWEDDMEKWNAFVSITDFDEERIGLGFMKTEKGTHVYFSAPSNRIDECRIPLKSLIKILHDGEKKVK